ncbi:hypothetical protein F1737_04020 [Methanoplanus sp. FWC-SCC4]|uniref:Uncharacterized protein n=1 Tax=Methanochimaera problematica TaxID=2609417 RepID=A0AA97FEF7_9EURY|nr:hypothetical protein [Methanoplanus sp. FWC-SCC4]WOF15921.1 hypothetical protein F1737_04020 [Methanoplanus sp. FWC-SCC4]
MTEKKNSTLEKIEKPNNILDKLGLISEPDQNSAFDTSVKKVTASGDFELDEISGVLLNEASKNFRGPGLNSVSTNIEVYDLIQDIEISDPDYMLRKNGLVIDINYKSGGLNNLQKTLWGYEVDATSIVKTFYLSKQKNLIGFIIINFNDENNKIPPVKFKLTAADMQKFKDSVKDGIYIKKTEWSFVKLDENSGIIPYEDPDSRIYADNILLGTNDVMEYTFLTSDEFKNYIKEKTYSLNDLAQDINEQYHRKEWVGSVEKSTELISLSEQYREEIRGIIVPIGLENAKSDYERALDVYSDSGMYLWYGITFNDLEKISKGRKSLVDGLDKLNDVLQTLQLDSIDKYKVIPPSTNALLVSDGMKLKDIYKYQDPYGFNDISLQVDTFGYKNTYYSEESKEYTTASIGKKYFYVVVDVTHLGYRGGKYEQINTPDNSDFTLYYMGEEFKDSTPEGYVLGLGHTYKMKVLDRKEHMEAVLIFEVPEDFSEKNAYLKVDLGSEGIPVWSFSYR